MKNLIDPAKSCTIPFAEAPHLLESEIANWQAQDAQYYESNRRWPHNLAQKDCARRAATTRAALFDRIDRKAAILRDWCKVEA